MKTLYQTQIAAEGDCAGHVRNADSTLGLPLSLLRGLGSAGGAAMNPERLFIIGYVACFENATLHVARGKWIKSASTSVTATVDIDPREDGDFALTVSLSATLGGVDQTTAEALVVAAHGVCPYSHVVRGDIDAQLNTVTR